MSSIVNSAENVAAAIEEITASVEEMSANIDVENSIAKGLSNKADDLTEKLKAFKV